MEYVSFKSSCCLISSETKLIKIISNFTRIVNNWFANEEEKDFDIDSQYEKPNVAIAVFLCSLESLYEKRNEKNRCLCIRYILDLVGD